MDVWYLVTQNSKKLIFKGTDLIKLGIITNVLIFLKCETDFFHKEKNILSFGSSEEHIWGLR